MQLKLASKEVFVTYSILYPIIDISKWNALQFMIYLDSLFYLVQWNFRTFGYKIPRGRERKTERQREGEGEGKSHICQIADAFG